MEWHDPETPEGKFWLDRYNRALLAWMTEGFASGDSLQAVLDALGGLFQSSPEFLPNLRRLALQNAQTARRAKQYSAAIPVARIGLQAAMLLDRDSPDNALDEALLSIIKTEMHIRLNELSEAVWVLDNFPDDIEPMPDNVGMVMGLAAALHYMRGWIAEEEFDPSAAKRYGKAADQARDLIDNATIRSKFLLKWIELTAGDPQAMPESQRNQLAIDAFGELTTWLTAPLLGICRMQRGEGAAERASAAIAAITEFEDPRTVEPVDYMAALADLDRNDADHTIAHMLELLEDLPNSAEYQEWRAMLELSSARRARAEGKSNPDALKRARELAQEAPGHLMEALVTAEAFLAEVQGVDSLLEALSALATGEDTPLRRLRIRAMFDEALSVAVDELLDRYYREFTPNARCRVAAILDTLRTKQWQPFPKNREPEGMLEEGIVAAHDYLKRIDVALQERGDALAIILQESPHGTLFLCLTGEDRAVVAPYAAGADLPEAVVALIEAANREYQAFLYGDDVDDETRSQGQRTFESWPPEVQELVKSAKELLIVPDIRAGQENIPFELLHDGTDFLGLSKVIARLPSVRHLVRAVENSAPTIDEKKAIVLAAMDVPRLPQLEAALTETEALRKRLTDAGWEAPELAPIKQRVCDGLDLVSLLHIAAHGDLLPSEEQLLLGESEFLSTKDLGQRSYAGLPFVYLNSCLVGVSRYLGGGQSRGMAQAFIELGAPAVIAALAPIEDSASSRLASCFYGYALEYSVGEALRLARVEVSGELPPTCWGNTVLLGDPDHVLPGSAYRKTMPHPAQDLLDIYTRLGDVDPKLRELARSNSILHGTSHPGDARMIAATELVVMAAKRWDLNNAADLADWETAVELAEQLDHLPMRGLLACVKVDHAIEHNKVDLVELDRVIDLIAPLTRREELWKRIFDRYLAAHARLVRGELPDERGDDIVAAVRNVQRAVQGRHERRHGVVGLRTEDSVWDLAWNAIVSGHHRDALDGHRCAGFASALARKLHARWILPEESRPYAHTLLTGLLYFLWGKLHPDFLNQEMVEGWSGTLVQAVEDIEQNWSPPTLHKWFQNMADSLTELDAVFLEWEQDPGAVSVPQILEFETTFAERCESKLNAVRDLSPSAVAGCGAWLLGGLLERNRFSMLGVPHLQKSLEQVTIEIAQKAEWWFQDYLMDGFEKVRTRKWDAIERWELGVEGAD